MTILGWRVRFGSRRAASTITYRLSAAKDVPGRVCPRYRFIEVSFQ